MQTDRAPSDKIAFPRLEYREYGREVRRNDPGGRRDFSIAHRQLRTLYAGIRQGYGLPIGETARRG